MTALKLLKSDPIQGLPGNYRDIRVWRRGMELARYIFSLSGHDDTPVIRKMRESAMAVPTRIAEGAARGSTADFLRHIAAARSALAGLDTHTILAQQLHVIDLEERRKIEILMVEIRSLLEQLAGRLV